MLHGIIYPIKRRVKIIKEYICTDRPRHEEWQHDSVLKCYFQN
jgi:hypothetical protein